MGEEREDGSLTEVVAEADDLRVLVTFCFDFLLVAVVGAKSSTETSASSSVFIRVGDERGPQSGLPLGNPRSVRGSRGEMPDRLGALAALSYISQTGVDQNVILGRSRDDRFLGIPSSIGKRRSRGYARRSRLRKTLTAMFSLCSLSIISINDWLLLVMA